ncbi:MAG: ATP-binding protein [Ruminococcus sp.]|nr:ATP-binding protein [Ruminococcus sp.]
MIRNDYLIKRKFNSYLVPGVLMAIAMQLGNIVDSILVSMFIDIDGLTAISLSMPVLCFMQMFGFAIGVGGAITISVKLGKRQLDDASGIFSVCVITVAAVSLVFTALSFVITHPLTLFLASTSTLQALLEPYLFIFICCIPTLNMCLVFSNIMTVDNNPKLGSAAFIVANAVNLTLDYIFLKYTDMGMTGAALSSVIGFASGILLVIPYTFSKKRMLRFSLREGLKQIRMIGTIIKNGQSQAMYFIMLILKYYILNAFIQNTLGADNMAIYAVCINSVYIVRLCVEGIIGVVQTIGGVLYGEKDYYGIRRLVKRTLLFCSVTVVVLMVVFLTYPQFILTIFSFNKPDLFDEALLCVRLFSFSFGFYAANRIVQVYYQTTLHAKISTMNTVLDGFVLLVPLSMLLIGTVGVLGVSIATIMTEGLSFLAVWIYRVIQQKRGRLPQKGFLMIPEKDGENLMDITVMSTDEQAVEISKKLIECCGQNGIVSEKANVIGVAAEELTANIVRYGYKGNKPSCIDINLSKVDNKLILRLRDDGVSFNPTEYNTTENEEGFLLGGIALIKSIADNMTYTRVLNMNNTVIEIAV